PGATAALLGAQLLGVAVGARAHVFGTVQDKTAERAAGPAGVHQAFDLTAERAALRQRNAPAPGGRVVGGRLTGVSEHDELLPPLIVAEADLAALELDVGCRRHLAPVEWHGRPFLQGGTAEAHDLLLD